MGSDFHATRCESLGICVCPKTQYPWTVVFRNDEMGFVKTVTVNAARIYGAVEAATEELENRGYDPLEFRIVSAVSSPTPVS